MCAFRTAAHTEQERRSEQLKATAAAEKAAKKAAMTDADVLHAAREALESDLLDDRQGG
jgi:hypothetical protein